MEELLVDAIMLSQKLAEESEYHKKLDELFLSSSESDDFYNDLLYLEWEKDIKSAVLYVRAHIDCNRLDTDLFGKILMRKLNRVYQNFTDIREFAHQMDKLWTVLPESLQNTEPFLTLSYADEPLSWGDEEQSRDLYERMLCYYENQTNQATPACRFVSQWRKDMKQFKIVQITAVIIFMLSLFCTVDLGLSLLYNTEPAIHDGSYAANSFLHAVFGIFGDSGWSFDRFFAAFRNSIWVTYALLVINVVLHFCKKK